jgi:hypothetical protein
VRESEDPLADGAAKHVIGQVSGDLGHPPATTPRRERRAAMAAAKAVGLQIGDDRR